jgi:hypothetical protein
VDAANDVWQVAAGADDETGLASQPAIGVPWFAKVIVPDGGAKAELTAANKVTC